MATFAINELATNLSLEEFIGTAEAVTLHLQEQGSRRVLGVAVTDSASVSSTTDASVQRWIICYARMSR